MIIVVVELKFRLLTTIWKTFDTKVIVIRNRTYDNAPKEAFWITYSMDGYAIDGSLV